MPTKECPVCGRTFAWRKKWARDWDTVRYCSARCRAQGVSAGARELDSELHRLVRAIPVGQVLHLDRVSVTTPSGEAPSAEAVRSAARRLVASGEAQMVQNGQVVDPSHAKGPIGLRRVRRDRMTPST